MLIPRVKCGRREAEEPSLEKHVMNLEMKRRRLLEGLCGEDQILSMAWSSSGPSYLRQILLTQPAVQDGLELRVRSNWR